MAMSAATYRLLKEHRNHLKRGGSLLEVGEANWYGDAPASLLLEDAIDSETRAMVREANQERDLFKLAKAAYAIICAPKVLESIDFHGTETAIKADLNFPVRLPRLYDLVINNGTIEHVFNICQALETMHVATKPGGIMIHDSPFTGWIDHGFFAIQPTLFYDLAHANDYEVISLSITGLWRKEIIRIESREQFHALKTIPDNSQLFVVLRKTTDAPFRIPMQGVYDGRLSEAGIKAWQERR